MAKVMIIEDDPLMIRMYERIFKLNKYDIETAFDGEEGLAKLKSTKNKPSIILLDVMMPKMNGFDVLALIKKDEELKDIPVIILTNLAGKEEAGKGIELGAVSYLVKSEHEPKDVVSIVEETIKKYSKN